MELKLRDIKINELADLPSIERDEILGKLFEQMQYNLNAALRDAMANYLGRDPRVKLSGMSATGNRYPAKPGYIRP